MTFSIVARDPATGQLGVAVSTCALAVGRAAPWARAGVGAVATQALSQRGYGPRLLDRLAAGDAAEAALDQLLATDQDADQRQVAVVGPAGAPAAWTGVGCLSACGHRTDSDSSAQGNMLASRSVIPSVAEGYAERARGSCGPAGRGAAGRRRGRRGPARPAVGRADRGLRQQGRRGALGGRAGGPAGRRRGRPGRRAGAAASAAARVRDRRLRAARAEAPEGVRELHGALAAAARGDREGARDALRTLRERPGWEGWLRRLRVNGRLPATEELLRY